MPTVYHQSTRIEVFYPIYSMPYIHLVRYDCKSELNNIPVIYQANLNQCKLWGYPDFYKQAVRSFDQHTPAPINYYQNYYTPDDAYQDYVYYQGDKTQMPVEAHDDYFFYADDWKPPTDDYVSKPKDPNQVFSKFHKTYLPIPAVPTTAPTLLPGLLRDNVVWCCGLFLMIWWQVVLWYTVLVLCFSKVSCLFTGTTDIPSAKPTVLPTAAPSKQELYKFLVEQVRIST